MPPSIGQRLRQAREERNLSLQKVEQSIRIRTKILEALESDDYSAVSSAAQARGFLRNYCEFLEIDLDAALSELQTANKEDEINGPFPQVSGDSLPDIGLTPEPASPPTPTDGLVAAQSETPALEADSANQPTVEETAKPKRGRKKKTDAETPIGELPSSSELVDTSPTKTKRGRKKKEVVNEEIIPVYAEPISPIPVDEPQPEASIDPVEALAVEESLPSVEPIDVVTNHAEDEKTNVEPEQLAVESETSPSLLEKLRSFVKIKLPKQETLEDVPSTIDAEETNIELPSQTPEEIFAEIGKQLRQRRELLSLSLDEVELHTRVRAVFLQALEEGAFDRLPSTVQLRGMLTNYSTFLDLDTDTLLLRFADALQLRHRLKYPDKPAGSRPPMPVATTLPPLRSFMAGDLIFGSLIIAVLFGLAIWGIGRVINMQDETSSSRPNAIFTPNVLSTEQIIPMDMTSTPIVDVVSPQAVTEIPVTVEIPLQPAGLTISILSTERAYLRIIVDGQIKFEGRAVPGSSYEYEAQDKIEVLTGNAAALRITFNGRDQGLLGGFGEVVSRIYTLDGIVTPTATLPPTATNTLPPTATAAQTEPPTPTNTP